MDNEIVFGAHVSDAEHVQLRVCAPQAIKVEVETLAKCGQTVEQVAVSRVAKRPIAYGIDCYLRSLGAPEKPETAWVKPRRYLSSHRLLDRRNRLEGFCEMRPRLHVVRPHVCVVRVRARMAPRFVTARMVRPLVTDRLLDRR